MITSRLCKSGSNTVRRVRKQRHPPLPCRKHCFHFIHFFNVNTCNFLPSFVYIRHAEVSQVPPVLHPSTNETHQPLVSTSVHRVSFSSSNAPSPSSPKQRSISTVLPLQPRFLPGDSLSSFHDLNPANFAPAHESRRRNAEQRAATLRADRLIGEVEPNRVFCSLCQKWVQLRQDSSYCAYPWLQHRGKCLARQ